MFFEHTPSGLIYKQNSLVSHLLKYLLYLLNYPLQYIKFALHCTIILKSKIINEGYIWNNSINRVEFGNYCL
jgi:hypothetical protein